jgi:hypothetical protein
MRGSFGRIGDGRGGVSDAPWAAAGAARNGRKVILGRCSSEN